MSKFKPGDLIRLVVPSDWKVSVEKGEGVVVEVQDGYEESFSGKFCIRCYIPGLLYRPVWMNDNDIEVREE